MQVSDILPPRALDDVIAQRVRVLIGGQEYLLPAKVIDDNERWKRSLDVVMTAFLRTVEESGDDADSALGTLAQDPDPFIELLRSYDHTGLLPDRDAIRATTTELELMIAVLECWRASNPKVDIALAAAETGMRIGALPRLTSSLLASTAGTLRPSGDA